MDETDQVDKCRRTVVAGERVAANPADALMFANVPDLDPDWAESHPDRALAWLFVSPRPCEALDRLFKI